jgi:hypothetical protein
MDTELTPRQESQVFTVRIWSEVIDEGSEHRGSVRNVASGAFRNFREWSDLTSFLDAQIESEPPPSQETR